MSDTWTGKKPNELNEATIEEVRKRIGIPTRYSPRQHNENPSTDSFRHFARGYGDDNPLYNDPAYATASSWGAPIAPPIYPFLAGIARPVDWSDAEKAIMKGGDPLAGIGQYMCGERWIFPKPIHPGDALYMSQALHSAELKASTFGGGAGALLAHRVAWEGEDGSPSAFRFLDFWHADREKSQKAAKKTKVERSVYTDEELERYDALYEAEEVRGAKPRLVSEVEVGEELGPIAKGPLTVTEIVSWHVGVGWGMFGSGSSKLAYLNRKRIPKFYLKNQYGIWDTAQRCHWDDEWAQRMGHMAAYDYGVMRSNWMVNLVTNWMGDDAWIWKMSTSVRKFNYQGDADIIGGVVREVDKANNLVVIDAWGDNQRGQRTCDARIWVLLPPAAGQHAVIPDYDPDQVPEATAP